MMMAQFEPKRTSMPTIGLTFSLLILFAVLGAMLSPLDYLGFLAIIPIAILTWHVGCSAKNQRIFYATVAVVFFHEVLLLYHVFIHLLPGGTADSHFFYARGASMAMGLPDSYRIPGEFLFIKIFTEVMKLDPSELFGGQLSIVVFVLSLNLILKMQNKLQIRRFRTLSVLLYGVLPSCAIWTSLIFIEPYFIFNIVLMSYFFINKDCNSLIRYLIIFCCLLVIAYIHPGYFLLSLGVFMILLGCEVLPYIKSFNKKRMTYTIAGIAALIFFLNHETLLALLHRGILYIDFYRTQLLNSPGNSDYNIILNSSGAFSEVLWLLNVCLHFIIGPFFWEVQSSSYFALMLYSLFKLSVLLTYIIYLFKRPLNLNYIYLLSLYFIISFYMSLGTTNYGTAIRHQVLANWIFFFFMLPRVLECLQNLIQRKLPKRNACD